MEPYSMDLRERVAAARDDGMQTSEAAETFGCCGSWVRRLMQRRRERGTLEPVVRQQPDQRGLDDTDRQHLRKLVEQRPDATLAELLAAMETKVHPGTLSRTLKIMGLPRKKRRCTPASVIGRT
jgi:transposase